MEKSGFLEEKYWMIMSLILTLVMNFRCFYVDLRSEELFGLQIKHLGVINTYVKIKAYRLRVSGKRR